MRRSVCFFAKVKSRDVLERVEFYAQDMQILKELGFDLQVATRLLDLRPADLYFVWWWTWAFYPVMVARTLRKPVVVTGVFDDWLFDSRPKLHQRLIKFALKGSDANIFISRLEQDQVAKRFGVNRPRYVPLAVDTNVYRPNGSVREDVVFSVGWLHNGNAERKGMPELIQAAPLIRKTHPEIRFVIAGEKGTAYPRLQELAQSLGVADAFEFVGKISGEEKIRWMQRCKVYLQPSRFEGFGLAMLEAMSCGAPVVSRPVGAVPEVVGDAGILVESDSPQAVAQAVINLLDEPVTCKELGDRSRKRAVESFPFERRKAELEKILNELLPGS
jgi:glycosyltransferase involved in cell wall biosynthesis